MTTHSNKTKIVFYWVVTFLISLGMFFGGIAQIIGAEANVEGMKNIGYPLYLLPFLGVLKIIGVVILLSPRMLLLKEWAYAGYFFLLTGALFSHIYSGESFGHWAGPLVFWLLIPVSWALRPESRRIASHTSRR
jgi:hypothetical protein